LPGLPADDGSPLAQAAVALAEARFASCTAALDRTDPRDPATVLLGARLRRDQGFPAEAEVLAREAATTCRDPVATALHAAILGDLGRDAEAGRLLRQLAAADFASLTGRESWLVSAVALAELCWTTRAASFAAALAERLLPEAGGFAAAAGGAGWAGSVSRALGLLAAASADWDAATGHLDVGLDDHLRVGAPVLVAHTERELAAVLRARGGSGDWERAVDLLAEAESIYRRLGIDSSAEDARVLLRRSREHHLDAPRTSVLARTPAGWRFGPSGATVTVSDSHGLEHLRMLLAQPGQRFHVFELVSGARGPAGTDEQDRLAALEAEGDRSDAGGRLGRALARAERELLVCQLGDGRHYDDLDRARRMVTTRVRVAIDRLEEAHPELGNHLRHSVQLGTFCSYLPARPVTWQVT